MNANYRVFRYGSLWVTKKARLANNNGGVTNAGLLFRPEPWSVEMARRAAKTAGGPRLRNRRRIVRVLWGCSLSRRAELWRSLGRSSR